MGVCRNFAGITFGILQDGETLNYNKNNEWTSQKTLKLQRPWKDPPKPIFWKPEGCKHPHCPLPLECPWLIDCCKNKMDLRSSSTHVVDHQISNDVDSSSIASADHAGELITVSGSGFQLPGNRLVPGPPLSTLDVLVGWGDLWLNDSVRHTVFSVKLIWNKNRIFCLLGKN